MAKMIIDIPNEDINAIKIMGLQRTQEEVQKRVDSAIQHGTPLPKEHGWIPISERLPEDRQRLLVTVVRYSGDKITRLAEYYSRNNGKGIFQIQENHEEWEVGEKGLLAWMPLPEPYKEVSE